MIQWATRPRRAAEFDRERILDEIVSSQNTDGGFSLSKGESDIDITAMALQAIAPYYNDFSRDDVRKSVDKAVEYLSGKQDSSGTFGSAEADSQVVIALCSLGIDPEADSRFCEKCRPFDRPAFLSEQRRWIFT